MKSRRPVSLVECAVKPACVRAFAQVVPARSARVEPALAKSDPERAALETTGRELLELKLNPDATAKSPRPVVNRRARSSRPHELQRVHQRRTPWPKEFRWPNRDR